MKAVIFIFTVIAAVLYIILGQVVYPLIASCFETTPSGITIAGGIVTFLIFLVLISSIRKTMIGFICTLIYLAAVIGQFAISLKCYDFKRYRGGYITADNGSLKNSFGVTIITNIDRFGDAIYKGIDNKQNEVIVKVGKNVVKWYNLDGTFIDRKEIPEDGSLYDNIEKYAGVKIDRIIPR